MDSDGAGKTEVKVKLKMSSQNGFKFDYVECASAVTSYMYAIDHVALNLIPPIVKVDDSDIEWGD